MVNGDLPPTPELGLTYPIKCGEKAPARFLVV
jgi:hypothetical protein